jgi:hypothetical protein
LLVNCWLLLNDIPASKDVLAITKKEENITFG